MTQNKKQLVPYVPDYAEWYQHLKDLRDGYVQPDYMRRNVVGTGKRNRQLIEMEVLEKDARDKETVTFEEQRPVVNQVTQVAQALEISKWEIQRKQKENAQTQNSDVKTAQHPWTGIRSDIKQQTTARYAPRLSSHDMYCESKWKEGDSSYLTQTLAKALDNTGWHSIFRNVGLSNFFDSLEHMPEDYGIGFENVLNKKYLKNVRQLQQSTSNVCGLYCAYFVLKRHEGKTMMDILKNFNLHQKKRNDRLIVT